MKVFFIFFISLTGLFALNSLLPGFYRSAAPNFLFLFAVFYALKKNSLIFLWLAFFAGLILDLFGGNFFGAQTFALLATCSLLAYATSEFFSAELSIELTSILIAAGYIIFATLVFALNLAAFNLHLAGYQVSPQIFEFKIWLDLMLNLVFAAPIYYLTVFIDRVSIDKLKI